MPDITLRAVPADANPNDVRLFGNATIVGVSAAVLTLAGQAIVVVTGQTVAVTPAALALTGQSLTVNARRIIAASAAALSVVGQSIAVNARTVIQAGAATIALLGQSVTVINLTSGLRQLWQRIRVSL